MPGFRRGSLEKYSYLAEAEPFVAVACAIRDRNAWHIPGGEGATANTTIKRVLATHADGRQTVEEVQDGPFFDNGDTEAMLESLRSQVRAGVGARFGPLVAREHPSWGRDLIMVAQGVLTAGGARVILVAVVSKDPKKCFR